MPDGLPGSVCHSPGDCHFDRLLVAELRAIGQPRRDPLKSFPGYGRVQLPPKSTRKSWSRSTASRPPSARKRSRASSSALAEKLVKSPLFSLMVTTAIEKQYLAKSGLRAEEKEQGSYFIAAVHSWHSR